LKDHEKENTYQRKLIPFFLLFLLIVLIYSNTFTSEWHLDDYANIVKNPYIRINNLHPKTLFQTFYFDAKKEISRPLARLSFGLNWYVGKDNVIGYHIVNIIIHQLTAFLLFLFVLNLFNTPNIRDKYQGSEYFVALLAAVLWAASPIQTQAVTYIVQRMASMAALFYILSMVCYLKGRINVSVTRKILYFIIACISFAFALATKENTATLPIAIILMEIIFFQDIMKPKTRKALVWAFVIICGIVAIASSQLFLNGKLISIFKGSSIRYFSPVQRLMTEARVIVFYLTEIFYPVPTRLSIEHDIKISTSLLNPWTTLPAIIFIVSLVCLGILQIKKRPLLSFGILFYLLNHIIESSVLGLELVFEHRNYLPSLFLFLYISAVIKWMLDQYIARNRMIYSIMLFFVTFMIMTFGISTYVRNMTWKTEQSLLEDAVQKAPNASRPLSNLARIYHMKTGKPDIFLKMLEKALTLKKNNTYQEAMILSSIGNVYYANGYDRKALRYYREAHKKHPGYATNNYKLAIASANVGTYKESKKHLNKVILKVPYNETAPLNLKGLIFAKEKKFNQAFKAFRKCLKKRKNDKNALLNIGALYYFNGNYRRAETFFEIAHIHHRNEIFALLWLIEVNLKTNDRQDIHKYLEKLFLMVSAKEILTLQKLLSDINVFDKGIMKPYPSDMLVKEIARKLKVNTSRID